MGVSFSVIEGDLQKQTMEKAGFVDVEVKDIKVRFALSLLNEAIILTIPGAHRLVAKRRQDQGAWCVYTGGTGAGRRGVHPVYDGCVGVDEGADFGVYEEVDKGDQLEEGKAVL